MIINITPNFVRSACPSASGNAEFPYDSTREIAANPLFVAIGGSDSNDGSIGSPWATINHALVQATASETIYVRTGTYDVDAISLRSQGNSGTSGNEIELTSYPGEEPVIDCQADSAGWIDIESKSFWKFRYLKITNFVNCFELGHNDSGTDRTFYSLLGETALGGDNDGFIKIARDNSPNTFIDRIKAVNTGTPHLNTGGIVVLTSTSGPNSDKVVTIDRTELRGWQQGIHFKHGNDSSPSSSTGNLTVSNSFIYDTLRNGVGYNPQGIHFINCIIGGGASETELRKQNGGPAGNWNTFDHCTIEDGIHLEEQTGGAKNNLFTDCIMQTHFSISTSSTVLSSNDYNLFAANIIRTGADAGPNDGTLRTLASWRTFNSSDANSVEGSPTYIGGDFSVIANWALDTGSNGENAASDGSDMGADVSLVGVDG